MAYYSWRDSYILKRILFTAIILTICLVFSSTSYSAELNDYSAYNVDIPDNGQQVNSDLGISGAPSGAVITDFRVYYEIRHANPADLDVWLTTYYDGNWHDYFLYQQGEAGPAADIIETRDNLHEWDGASPNQTWYIVVRDNVSGDVGYIDFFEIWVTYTLPPSGDIDLISAVFDEKAYRHNETIYGEMEFRNNNTTG